MQGCCVTKTTDIHFKDTEKGEKEKRRKKIGDIWRREKRGSGKRKGGEREIENERLIHFDEQHHDLHGNN